MRAAVFEAGVERSYNPAASDPGKPPKSILKNPKAQLISSAKSKSKDLRSPSPPRLPRPSKGVRDRLAADDAEIAALEKALGVRSNKGLPHSFKGDGLDALLEDLDGTPTDNLNANGKRGRNEEDSCLQEKRRKAHKLNSIPIERGGDELLDTQIMSDGDEASKDGSLQGLTEPSDNGSIDGSDGSEPFTSLSEDESSPKPIVKKVRENPYIAPPTSSGTTDTAKYVPPRLRHNGVHSSADNSQLRRRAQGLLNRLSEANLLALLKDFEALFRDNPRQEVSSMLLDLLLDLLADPTILQDTFVILHAGFIAALYRVVGSDFGAQVVSRAHDEFERLHGSKGDGDATSKKLTNLVNVFAHLYNFKVIGSSLIYDLIRLFIEEFSETHTELLLRVMRSG